MCNDKMGKLVVLTKVPKRAPDLRETQMVTIQLAEGVHGQQILEVNVGLRYVRRR